MLIDGGTEGLYGQCRVIKPFKTACYECTMTFTAPTAQFQLCTIASVPRLPEHCIAYAMDILWKKEKVGEKFDSDSMEDMTWVFEKALERAEEFKIEGVTYSLTMGVTKNIIPAIASSNATIASLQATEALKLVTGCSKAIHNNTLVTCRESLSASIIAFDKLDKCEACSIPLLITVKKANTLNEIMQLISDKYEFPRDDITFISTTQLLTLFGKKQKDYLEWSYEKLVKEGKIEEGDNYKIS